MTGDAHGPVTPAEPCPSVGAAVAHAWHAAEPEDEQRLLEHLPDCAVCEAAIVDALAVGAEMAMAVPPHDPPAALRDRILAAVAAEPSPPAGPAPGPGRPAGPPTERAVTRPRPRRAASGRSARHGRAFGSLVLLTAAVVLGVVLLAGRALLPGSTGTEQASPAPASDPSSLAAQAAQVVDDAEADDPGVRHAVLRDGDGRAVAVVLDGAEGGDAPRVVALALAPPPSGRSWVLWGTATGPPAALGAVDRSTGRSAGNAAAEPDRGWRGFAVSVEPSGALPARPSEVLATGSVV